MDEFCPVKLPMTSVWWYLTQTTDVGCCSVKQVISSHLLHGLLHLGVHASYQHKDIVAQQIDLRTV